MTETSWPSAQDITNANGQVIQNPDGTISVYTYNSITGNLAPQSLVKSSCDALGITNAYWDSTKQQCRWSNIDCSVAPNIVLNTRGNDGTMFAIYPDQTCTLSVDFDYLFKFDCATLTQLASGIVTGTCNTIIDVFESIGASISIDVVESQTNFKTVYEQKLFNVIGSGNLYNYLSTTGTNTGFFICGESVTNTSDTTCHPLNLYNLNASGNSINCGIVANQLITQLYDESGLNVLELTAFTQNINANAFGANWQHFHTDITDPTVISAMTNQKIKLSIQVSGICIDTCVLLDNITLNHNCVDVKENTLFLTQSPGFQLDRVRDNKKSWIANSSTTQRTFSVTDAFGNNPIRYTDYYIDNSNQAINTKEINLDINLAEAVETDVWSFISNNPCILTGVSIGTTLCVKEAGNFYPNYTVITSTTLTLTSTTSATTIYSCPLGYTATSLNSSCQSIIVTGATYNGSGSTIVAGDKNTLYGTYGAFFYPNVLNDGALPVTYSGGTLVDQSGGTISPIVINNTSPFWASLGSIANGRLNNAGLSASTTEWLGFSECISAQTGGTYYLGIGADNYAQFSLNGTLIVDFSSSTAGTSYYFWSVFEIQLNAGVNIIEMIGKNAGGFTAFAAEIYEPTSFATLTGATSSGITGANVIFSTIQKIGMNFDLGTTMGYTCPTNFALNTCATPPTCSKIDNVPIMITTGTTTVFGYTTGYTYTTAHTGTIICTPQIYCCSEYCGDANVDINSLMTQPLSAVSTIEDFEYYLTTELIDAKNRKTISSYPTLRLLYDRYMNSTNLCGLKSAEFNYFNMDSFANLVGNYWVSIIEQVIPATTLWGSTKIYTNTIFDNNKFKYKSYSTLFGYDGSFSFDSYPASGISCSVSATTKVIEGNSLATASFFTQGQSNDYSNVYLIQMNSGSEFYGTVSVVGPNAPALKNTINECGIQVIIDTVEPSYNQSNGSATAHVYGSNGPVTFLWNNGATTQTISNIPAEVYSVTVTDTSMPNCTAYQEIYLTELPCDLALTTTSTNANNILANGTASVTVTGGLPPYYYEWGTSPIQTGTTATGLTTGDYIITVTDSVFCQADTTVNVGDIPCTLTANVNILNGTNGNSNGSITAIPAGGTPPYTYIWNTSYTGQTITGITSGTFSVIVTDYYQCSASTGGTVSNLTCNLTSTITTVDSQGNLSNGSATVTASGGTPPYTYSWSNGQTTATANNLSGNTSYSVTVIDNAGCNYTNSAFILDIPCNLTVNLSSTNTAGNLNNGTASATILSGHSPYTYIWNTVPVQTTATATGLSASTYTVTVKDIWNCTYSGNVTVSATPCTLNATLSSTTSHGGFANGTATATVTAGTAPYTYSWNTSPVQTKATATGLTPSTYTVTIKDALNCVITPSITVNNTPCALTVSTTHTDTTATAIPAGGSGSYSYSWSNGQTTATATSLVAGTTYTVTVTDTLWGCTATTSVVPGYSLTIDWAYNGNMVSTPTASLYYKINSGSYKLLKTTSVPANSTYGLLGTVTGLTSGNIVTMYVQSVTSPTHYIEFQDSMSNGYCETLPYSVTVTNNQSTNILLLADSGDNTIFYYCPPII
jgi:hypothetical protein